MRLLVHARALPGRPGRLGVAALGLALRGHEILWHGPLANAAAREAAGRAPTLRHVQRARDARGSDVVLASGPSALAAAAAGWLSGARGMVLSLQPADPGRWGPLTRLAWSSLDSFALCDGAHGDFWDGSGSDLPAERLQAWPAGGPPDAADAGHADVEILERFCERLVARARGSAPRPALFLDRDGTLVVERGYLADPDDVELLPGVAEALRVLRAAGYALVIISNQSGVGRGLFPLARVHAAMARLRAELRLHGVELDAVHFCPHRPEEGCACRKPRTELIARAAGDLRLAVGESVMVGDKLLDVATGHGAGAGAVLVRTGYGREEERRLAAGELARPPELVADDLPAALPWLLEHRAAAGGD